MLGKILFIMNLWSDPNLAPYIAATSHWIEVQTIQTPDGPEYLLFLWLGLIGFHHVLGRHGGAQLANAFLKVIDCVVIAGKVMFRCLISLSKTDMS